MYIKQLNQNEAGAAGAPLQPQPATAGVPSNPFAAGFGITSETRSEGVSPLFPNEQNPFPMVLIRKIEAAKRVTSGVEKTVLLITITDKETQSKSHTHTEWPIDKFKDQSDLIKKMNAMNGRIKHIWDICGAPLPEGGIGVGAASFDAYFEAVAKAFNTGLNGGAVYLNKPLWVKLTIALGYENKGFQFPYLPPIFENVSKDGNGNIIHARALVIDPTKETIKQSMSTAAVGNSHSAAAPGAAPGGPAAPQAFPAFPMG